jgi:hypothetical protein
MPHRTDRTSRTNGKGERQGHSRIGKPTPVSPPVEGRGRGREGKGGDGAPGGRALPTTSGHDRAWWVQGVATAAERLDTPRQTRASSPTKRRGWLQEAIFQTGWYRKAILLLDAGVWRWYRGDGCLKYVLRGRRGADASERRRLEGGLCTRSLPLGSAFGSPLRGSAFAATASRRTRLRSVTTGLGNKSTFFKNEPI